METTNNGNKKNSGNGNEKKHRVRKTKDGKPQPTMIVTVDGVGYDFAMIRKKSIHAPVVLVKLRSLISICDPNGENLIDLSNIRVTKIDGVYKLLSGYAALKSALDAVWTKAKETVKQEHGGEIPKTTEAELIEKAINDELETAEVSVTRMSSKFLGMCILPAKVLDKGELAAALSEGGKFKVRQ